MTVYDEFNISYTSHFTELKHFLDAKADQYNCPDFIENDPVVIPHQFSLQQDIEIMGFFAAMLAWGQRKTIISKCHELLRRFGGSPYDFILNHQSHDLRALLGFKHRTFNDTDLLYFVEFFRQHYSAFHSLEDAFLPSETGLLKKQEFRDDFKDGMFRAPHKEGLSSPVCYQDGLNENEFSIETALNHFRSYFFNLPDFPPRTVKHVSSPAQGSACKRLNMFLRWMVRNDGRGVDFGLWKRLDMSALICPCDLHVERVARKLGLITRKQTDWQTATELTSRLHEFDPADPVKYDFALFGLGIEGEF